MPLQGLQDILGRHSADDFKIRLEESAMRRWHWPSPSLYFPQPYNGSQKRADSYLFAYQAPFMKGAQPMKDRKLRRFEAMPAAKLLRYLLVLPLMLLIPIGVVKSEEDSEDKAGAFTKATQAIEAKIEDAADHYVRSQYAKAVDVLSGVDKEIDALVAKHPQAVAKWYPSIQKAMVYAILAESHKRQSAHYERLYKKGLGKTVPMDEALRIIERDKPQAIIEVVPKKPAPTNDADFPL